MMRIRGDGRTKIRREQGVTLAEMLVVIAIIGLFLLVALPAVANYIRSAKIRTAADTLAKDISSCRYIAVTTRTTHSLSLVGGSTPAYGYTFTDVHGRTRTVDLPAGVSISAASNFPVSFNLLGGLTGSPATAIVRGSITTSRAHEYTITVEMTGRVLKTFNGNA